MGGPGSGRRPTGRMSIKINGVALNFTKKIGGGMSPLRAKVKRLSTSKKNAVLKYQHKVMHGRGYKPGKTRK